LADWLTGIATSLGVTVSGLWDTSLLGRASRDLGVPALTPEVLSRGLIAGGTPRDDAEKLRAALQDAEARPTSKAFSRVGNALGNVLTPAVETLKWALYIAVGVSVAVLVLLYAPRRPRP
jgi:hypothetical protein